MSELSTPPDREVEWKVRKWGDRRFRLRVRACSWFAARDLAAAALGVGRDDVEVVR